MDSVVIAVLSLSEFPENSRVSVQLQRVTATLEDVTLNFQPACPPSLPLPSLTFLPSGFPFSSPFPPGLIRKDTF